MSGSADLGNDFQNVPLSTDSDSDLALGNISAPRQANMGMGSLNLLKNLFNPGLCFPGYSLLNPGLFAFLEIA